MSALAALPSWVGPAVSLGGTLLSASSQRSAGRAAAAQASQSAAAERMAAEYEAVQHEYIGGQAQAQAQREAEEQRKVTALMASKVLAAAAASGAGASDPTVVDIISGIMGEGAYRASLAMYEGEEENRLRKMAAEARRAGGQAAAGARMYEGQSIAKASNLSAFSTILRGGASLLSMYGAKGAATSTFTEPTIEYT